MALNLIVRIGGRRLCNKSCSRPKFYFEFPSFTHKQSAVSKVGANQNIGPFNKLSTHTGANDSDSVPCWKCGVTVDLNKVLFCDYCEVVQKPKFDADYFEILGMEKKFQIDTKKLTKNFRLLQMQLHPDRFSQKSEVLLLKSYCHDGTKILVLFTRMRKKYQLATHLCLIRLTKH